MAEGEGTSTRGIVRLGAEQLSLLDRLFAVRSYMMAAAAAALCLAPGIGKYRWATALGMVCIVIPGNERIRRLVRVRWRGLPLWVPWSEVFLSIAGMMYEPSLWAPILLLIAANLSLPFAVFSRRATAAIVGVAGAGSLATVWSAPTTEPINLLIMCVVTLPVTYHVISGLGGRSRIETRRRVHLLNGLDALTWEFNVEQQQFTFVSERAERRFGTPSSDWLADPTAWLRRVHPDDRAQLTGPALNAATPGILELRVVDGPALEWWRLTLSRATHSQDEALVHGVMVDISDLRRAQAALLIQAQTDALTGLPNRAALMDDLRRRTAVSSNFGLLLIDLDAFKNVNDSLGHEAGDALLTETAARLLAACPGDGIVARLGGDEFALVVVANNARAAAQNVANAIAASLLEPIDVVSAKLRIKASIGIAVWPTDADDAVSLLRRADMTMYVAKRSHLGSTHFEQRYDDASLRTTQLMTDLPTALANGEIRVALQPRVLLDTGVVVGAEALARWNHPTLGDISPLEFIPIAELTGSTGVLAKHMLRETGRIATNWSNRGQRLEFAVNVTASDLISPGFLDTVEALPTATGMALDVLVLEITETQVMEHLDMIQPTLARLNTLGVRMSLDDFGTGHSSFARLRDLRMAELKIDRSFITSLGQRSANEPIVRSIIELARNLGLTVVAEGVEDEATVERLRSLGCDQAQGFFIGRPVSQEKFELLHFDASEFDPVRLLA
jgi:diguanylate cyclase (GGDEF)-like protein